MRSILFAASAGLLAAACATDPGVTSRYQQEYDELTETCRDRGGILVPLGSGSTGRPATDYACVRQDIQLPLGRQD